MVCSTYALNALSWDSRRHEVSHTHEVEPLLTDRVVTATIMSKIIKSIYIHIYKIEKLNSAVLSENAFK